MAQVSRETATNNINARLTSLEDFVCIKYGNAVGVYYPSVTIALNKTVSMLEELYIKLESMSNLLPGIKEAVQVMSDQRLNDKMQISAVMHTVISCLKEVEVLSAENNTLVRHSCLDGNTGTDSFVVDFVRRADLGRDISSGPNQTSCSNLEE
eukprot:8322183-Ditylum_brightwellii.AAC.1